MGFLYVYSLCANTIFTYWILQFVQSPYPGEQRKPAKVTPQVSCTALLVCALWCVCVGGRSEHWVWNVTAWCNVCRGMHVVWPVVQGNTLVTGVYIQLLGRHSILHTGVYLWVVSTGFTLVTWCMFGGGREGSVHHCICACMYSIYKVCLFPWCCVFSAEALKIWRSYKDWMSEITRLSLW